MSRRRPQGLGVPRTVRFAQRCAVVALALLGLAARAQAGATGLVESIKASEGEGGATALVIGVSAKPTFTTWKLEQPARVVVDISGTRLGRIDVPFDANTYAVGNVAASVSEGEGGPRTRVVLTLRRAADYDLDSSAGRITVTVRPHDLPPAAVVAQQGGANEAKRQAENARIALAAETHKLEEERMRSESLRRSAEEAHRAAAAETDKLRGEQARAEAERQSSEAARAAAASELTRVAEERRRADEARAESERARKEAESARAEAERATRKLASDRSSGDASRAEIQKARAEAESRRAEAEKRLAEAEKRQSDADRAVAAAERGRQAAEAHQRDAEKAQAIAEARMAEAEKARAAADKRMAEAEKARASASDMTQKLAAERASLDERRQRAEAAERAALAASEKLRSERAANDKANSEASQRLVAERSATEQARQASDRAASERSTKTLAAERAAVEQARLAADRAAETSRKLAAERIAAEQARIAAERSAAESARRLAAEKAAAEQARLAAERNAAESSQRLAAEKAAAEQARLAADRAAEASKKLVAERLAAEQAKAAAEQSAAESARKLAAEKATAEQAKLAAERSAAESAKRLAAEKAAAEAARATAERVAAETSRQLAAERAESERVRQAAASSQQQAQQDRAAAAAALARAQAAERQAEARLSAGAANQAAGLQAERDRARAESAAARAASERANAEVERLARERQELARLRDTLDARGRTLAQAEGEARKTLGQASESERRTQTARRLEEERTAAAESASRQLEEQRRQLERKRVAQEAQTEKLAEAQRLVAARDAGLKRAAADLARRETDAAAAAARLKALAGQAGATQKARDDAARALAQAESERREAALAATRGKRELDQAVAARRAEEQRRSTLERERQAEEQRLASAATRRAAEEQRLAQATEARRREEARMSEALASRTKAESERTRLESERQALVAEIGRLKQTALLAKASPPSPPAPVAPAPQPLVAAHAVEPALARPFSITLRAPSHVERIDFVDEPTRSSVIVDLDEPSAFTVERLAGRRVSLRLFKTDLPRGLERSVDATEYLGPVRVISSYRDPAERGAVRIDVDMAEDVPNDVHQDGGRLTWSFRKTLSRGPASLRPAAFAARLTLPPRFAGFSSAHALAPLLLAQSAPVFPNAKPGASKKHYNGRRIDLDFNRADIHNILHLLSDVGGVNVVTSDDVKGEVTIKMRDVPWDQALDVVLRQKQLGQVREGNLIRVAPLAVLEKELEQEIARQKQITEVLPTETRLIGVSYADAKNLVERARDLLTPRGKISVDDRTNTLIVSDVARSLSLIEELVRNLDTQTSQVVIEARIVEARSTFTRQIGVQWGGSGFADTGHGNPTGLVFPHNIGIAGGATDSTTNVSGLVPGPQSGTGSASPNFAVNLPAAVGTGSGGALGLTLGSVAGAFNLNLRLSAMESTGQVRILSSPRISTLDNHEANISQGVSVPISVVSAQGVSTVFVDAQLNLTVKPHVTNDGTVMMGIKVTRNEPDFVNTGARGDPTILKKEANTMLLVRDGDTAVIGGIYQRNSGLSFDKLPFFADLPIVGALFRNRKENDDRTEFLVFITPRIANRAHASAQ